jgi:hypothetical protein
VLHPIKVVSAPFVVAILSELRHMRPALALWHECQREWPAGSFEKAMLNRVNNR